IIYPTEDTVWRVGEHVNVTFSDDVPPNQTVSLFFANSRQTTLGGGPLDDLVFPFTVPASALSHNGGKSLLLAVRRENRHLSFVNEVNVAVVPEH
ncbi:hypothetical protein BDB00DRAFT_757938, partial [Zychaea mexicana]|uniref:uncharacterized protein n=1 Tax=Zychaea mexicana TaxID=64656 RepID=UPI0022FF2EFD